MKNILILIMIFVSGCGSGSSNKEMGKVFSMDRTETESLKLIEGQYYAADDSHGIVWRLDENLNPIEMAFKVPYEYRDLEAIAWDQATRTLYIFSGACSIDGPHLWVTRMDVSGEVELLWDAQLSQEYEGAEFIPGTGLVVTFDKKLYSFNMTTLNHDVLLRNYGLPNGYQFRDVSWDANQGLVYVSANGHIIHDPDMNSMIDYAGPVSNPRAVSWSNVSSEVIVYQGGYIVPSIFTL
jgi:hypothetical protein